MQAAQLIEGGTQAMQRRRELARAQTHGADPIQQATRYVVAIEHLSPKPIDVNRATAWGPLARVQACNQDSCSRTRRCVPSTTIPANCRTLSTLSGNSSITCSRLKNSRMRNPKA